MKFLKNLIPEIYWFKYFHFLFKLLVSFKQYYYLIILYLQINLNPNYLYDLIKSEIF